MKGLSAVNSVAVCRGYDSREEMIQLTGIDPDTIDDDDERTWPPYKVVETITIERLSKGGFNVRKGDRFSDMLSFDEMLGTVASLTMPDHRPCLQWMLTKEQHDKRTEFYVERRKQNQSKLITS